MRMLWYWPFARPEELDWARAVADGGHEVVVQVIDRPAAPPAGVDGGVEVRCDLPEVDRSVPGWRWITSRAGTYARRAAARRSLLRTGGFDVVHYHYVNRFTDSWRRPPGLWVISVHDVVPHVSRLGRLEPALLRRLYARPDGLIVHHEWIRDALVSGFDVDPDRIAIVPHQVFPVADPVQRSAPSEQPPMVLFFGALRENKGLEVLLEAMRRIPPDTVRLHVAGRGDTRLEELAERAASEMSNVTAEIGFVDHQRKAELFRECSVVALPYTAFTSQSGVLHDAYGNWRPVVATDVGALGPTVRDDETGVVVPSGDAESLAAGIVAMVGPAGAAPAAAARRIAWERSPESVAKQTMLAYERWMPKR